jgi:hypothetical protein
MGLEWDESICLQKDCGWEGFFLLAGMVNAHVHFVNPSETEVLFHLRYTPFLSYIHLIENEFLS